MMQIRSKPITMFIASILGAALLCLPTAAIEAAQDLPIKPVTNLGHKWRIGYYEGGPYVNYPINLRSIVKGLAELGWLDRRTVDRIPESADAETIWKQLSQSRSIYLDFVSSAFWSANWDDDLRARNKTAVIKQLRSQKLDFIIAMGTWAGQDLANHEHKIPTMVVSSSDPVKSGIVKNASRSGIDHVHARCDPNRYIRQLLLFHDIIGFKRLGVVYEKTVTGRSYAAMDDIETVAARRGFEVLRCEAPWSGLTPEVCTQGLIKCHHKLAPDIDALYFTVHRGVDHDRMDEILAPLMAHGIPTWSQRGPREVRDGVMISITRGGLKAIGMYHAGIMARIFNGATPGALDQIYEDPKKIAINLKTAAEIEFTVPRGLLRVADEIYR